MTFSWRSCCPPSLLLNFVASEEDKCFSRDDCVRIGFSRVFSSTKYGTMYSFISSSAISRCPPDTFTNLTLPASSNVLKPIQSSIYSSVCTRKNNTIKNPRLHWWVVRFNLLVYNVLPVVQEVLVPKLHQESIQTKKFLSVPKPNHYQTERHFKMH